MIFSGIREMAQQVIALVILAEDLDSILSTHMMAYNHLELQLQRVYTCS